MRQFFTLFCFIFSLSFFAQESVSPLDTFDVELQKTWVDSTYNALSLKEKIGLELSPADWGNVFNLPFKINRDSKLQWFQYRINHNILPTNTQN